MRSYWAEIQISFVSYKKIITFVAYKGKHIMERFFNTAGPNKPDSEYTIDPLSRVNLDEITHLINQKKYFVLHAPRQTGKTSMLLALRDFLNKSGDYLCVYANIDISQTYKSDTEYVISKICTSITNCLEETLIEKKDCDFEIKQFENVSYLTRLMFLLIHLSNKLATQLILFLKGIDTLSGDALASALHQIRSVYEKRTNHNDIQILIEGEKALTYYNQCGKIFSAKIDL